MTPEEALREAERRCVMAASLDAQLLDAADVLDRVQGSYYLPEALRTAADDVLAMEAINDGEGRFEEHLRKIADEVAPLTCLLANDNAVTTAWTTLRDDLHSSVDLDVPEGYGEGKGRRYRHHIMARLAKDIDPDALAELLCAMLKDGSMSRRVWDVLRDGLDALPPGPEPVARKRRQS